MNLRKDGKKVEFWVSWSGSQRGHAIQSSWVSMQQLKDNASDLLSDFLLSRITWPWLFKCIYIYLLHNIIIIHTSLGPFNLAQQVPAEHLGGLLHHHHVRHPRGIGTGSIRSLPPPYIKLHLLVLDVLSNVEDLLDRIARPHRTSFGLLFLGVGPRSRHVCAPCFRLLVLRGHTVGFWLGRTLLNAFVVSGLLLLLRLTVLLAQQSPLICRFFGRRTSDHLLPSMFIGALLVLNVALLFKFVHHLQHRTQVGDGFPSALFHGITLPLHFVLRLALQHSFI